MVQTITRLVEAMELTFKRDTHNFVLSTPTPNVKPKNWTPNIENNTHVNGLEYL
jgi:hypothetical protein